MSMREIPDTSSWKPKKEHELWLRQAYIEQCSHSEDFILSRLEFEKKTNLQAFDAGLPLEEVVSLEFAKLFPKRYNITNGIVSDNSGQTAGDCDLIIFNDFWFPHVLHGTSNSSRKKFLPIDGVYAIGEIKSTLNENSLDSACEKLVKCARLDRNWTNNNRLIENRENGCFHGVTNPLYTFIIAAGVESRASFESLINRFFDINKQLKRLEVVRALCVLGYGAVIWGFDNEKNEKCPALFMNEDLYKPIFPIYLPYEKQSCAMYSLTANIHMHLFNSVLAPEDFAFKYGTTELNFKVPTSNEVTIPPDPEWLDKLKISCKEDH